MMPRTRLAAVFVAIFLFSLIAMMPLRFVVAWLLPTSISLNARAVTGSVWRGRFAGLGFGEAVLGDFDAAFMPSALLRGGLALRLSGVSDPASRATLVATFAGVGADDVTLQLGDGTAFAPLPIETVDIREASIRLAGNRCVSALGQVRVNIAANTLGIRLDQGLVGMLRCEGGALAANLVSQSAMERVVLRVSPGKGYLATIIIKPDTPEQIAKLSAIGFRESGQGFVMQLSGPF